MTEQSMRRFVCDGCGLETAAQWGYPTLFAWAKGLGWQLAIERKETFLVDGKPVIHTVTVDLCPDCAKKVLGVPEGKSLCPASKSTP